MAVSSYVPAWRKNGDPLHQLFGLPFGNVGLSLAAGRFVLDVHLRKHIVYLVTDRRIVIDRRGAWPSTKSLDVGRLPEIELEERPSGSGTIRFGTARGWLDPNDFGTWQPALDPRPQFIRLPEARSVYDLVQRQSPA